VQRVLGRRPGVVRQLGPFDELADRACADHISILTGEHEIQTRLDPGAEVLRKLVAEP
jgi:hypothetical protein